MLASLALGEKSIGELGEPFAMTFARREQACEGARKCRTGRAAKGGAEADLRAKGRPAGKAEDWLRQWESFWSVRLDRLQALIEGKPE